MTVEETAPADLVKDFDPTDPRVVRDPYPVYALMRQECPIGHGSRFGGFHVVSRFADVCAAAHDTGLFSSAQGVSVPDFGNPLNAIPLEVDPPDHTKWRHLIQAWFSPQYAASLEPMIRRIVRDLIEKFADRGHADLAQELAVPVPPMIIAHMIGLPEEDWSYYREITELMLTAAAAEDSQVNAEQALQLFSYLYEQLEDRREHPRDDLLSKIVQLRYEGRDLTEEEVLGITFLLVVAGHETTTGGIGLLLWQLAQHPEVQDLIRDDPDLRFSAVEESLRLDPPVQYFSRTVTRDTTFAGTPMAEGEKILLAWASANRDPDAFDRPDEFVYDRANNRHLSFGSGPHRCIGAHLARLEIRVTVEEVLNRLPTFRLADPGAVEMAGVITRWAKHLPVVW
ncbi:MAG: cytochrome P450 [Acidimicrobiia bacterium]